MTINHQSSNMLIVCFRSMEFEHGDVHKTYNNPYYWNACSFLYLLHSPMF